MNAYLDEAEKEAKDVVTDLLREGLEPTARRIKERFAERLEGDDGEEEALQCFVEYSRQHLSNWRGNDWSYETMLAYQTGVNKLEKYASKEGLMPLRFEEVTPGFCRGLQGYLRDELGNMKNTRHKNLSTLKGFYKQAMEDRVIEWGHNPFGVLTLSKQGARKEKLTTDELREMRDVELDGGSLLADIRRYFFFAFYAGGMRYGDVARLKRRHLVESPEGVRAKYRMGKTENLHAVLLVPEALETLRYYGWREKQRDQRVFPILDGYDLSTPESRRSALGSQNALANKYLKKLAARAGIEKNVTFHLSRHSTVCYLYEQGYPKEEIQEVVGHASVAQTEHYLEGFQTDGPDDASQSLSL
jgi:site-specific recombinase XerD